MNVRGVASQPDVLIGWKPCYIVVVTNPLLSRITSDPAIFGGKPIIRGQRFAVEHLLGYLGAGMSEAEVLDQFSFLEPDDIKAALLYAGKLSGMTRMSGAAVGAASEEAEAPAR